MSKSLGIDVSENNGTVNWLEVARSGVEFAIIRLGYGNRHLDSAFYENINGAINAGLKVGVYYYSYALNEESAVEEAKFLLSILKDGGLTPDKLPMGVWFDMEDADHYKANRGLYPMENRQLITNMCSRFIVECNKENYSCGIYASYDWLENVIDTNQLADYVPYWVAQWSDRCDFYGASMWQFTDSYEIGGKLFDANYSF